MKKPDRQGSHKPPHPARVLIIGVSGFLGRHLAAHLAGNGMRVFGTSRNAETAGTLDGVEKIFSWDGRNADRLAALLSDVNAVINLAGEPLRTTPWSPWYRSRLRDSRIRPAAALAAAATVSRHLRVIQGSAVGFYGDTGDHWVDENSSPGNGFLSSLVTDWELAATTGKSKHVSLAVARTGVVMGADGGAGRRLEKFRTLGVIPLPGGGRQWVAWIDMSDYLEAVRFLLSHPELTGTFNLAAPNPVRFSDLVSEPDPGKRPVLRIFIPRPLVRITLGTAAETILLGQRVKPERLLEAGFRFSRPEWRAG